MRHWRRTAPWRCLPGSGVLALALLATVGFVPAAGASAGVTVTEKQFGFSFSLPSRWVHVPLDSQDIGTILKEATKADPSLTNVLDAQVEQATKQGLKVFAVGPVADGYLPNLTVGVISSTGELTASAFIAEAAVQVKVLLAEAHAQHVVTSTAHLALGDALEVSCAFRLKTSNRSAEEVQLYIEHQSHVDVVTFTSLSQSEDQSLVRSVTNSWRWI
ncbi:MAG: hypothetical protein WCF24_01110 [Acidimicrobiales bacterium]